MFIKSKNKIIIRRNKYLISICSKKKINYYSKKENFIIGFFGEMIDKNNEVAKLENIGSKLLKFNYKDTNKIKNFLSNYYGSFSFFYINLVKKISFIANDRFGLNHIFYSIQKKNKYHLIVSDHLDMIKNNLKKNFLLNKNFASQYILCRYDDIYGKNDTIYKDIFFLKASHVKIFNLLNFKNKQQRYWNFQKEKEFIKPDINESIKTLDDKITNSIKNLKFNKNKSIVAVSGGMDSTTTCYYLNKLNIKIPSFTVNYDVSTNLNESINAKKVAKMYCKNWKEIKIDYKIFIKYWKECYNYHAQPLPTSSCLGYDIIFDKVSKLGYKNIINSGSSDDLYGSNYPGFIYNLSDLYLNKKKNEFRKELKLWIKYYSTKTFPKNIRIFKDFLKKNIKSKNIIEPSLQLIHKNNIILRKKISFKKEKIKSNSLHHAWILYGMWICGRPANSVPMKEGEIKFNLSSLDPYLDKNLINYAWKLPANFKIRDGQGKYILRKLMTARLPKKITSNFIKTGYDVPIKSWLLINEFKSFVLDSIDDNNPFLKKLIDTNKLKNEIRSNSPNINVMFLWQVTNFCLWYNKNKYA